MHPCHTLPTAERATRPAHLASRNLGTAPAAETKRARRQGSCDKQHVRSDQRRQPIAKPAQPARSGGRGLLASCLAAVLPPAAAPPQCPPHHKPRIFLQTNCHKSHALAARRPHLPMQTGETVTVRCCCTSRRGALRISSVARPENALRIEPVVAVTSGVRSLCSIAIVLAADSAVANSPERFLSTMWHPVAANAGYQSLPRERCQALPACQLSRSKAAYTGASARNYTLVTSYIQMDTAMDDLLAQKAAGDEGAWSGGTRGWGVAIARRSILHTTVIPGLCIRQLSSTLLTC